MISEKTLRKWRKDALTSKYDANDAALIMLQSQEKDERILRLTQELLDQHLMRKG
jgi:3-deoxy-D-manno-octulosonic-acid transferase